MHTTLKLVFPVRHGSGTSFIRRDFAGRPSPVETYAAAEDRKHHNSCMAGYATGMATAAAYVLANVFDIKPEPLSLFGPLGTPIVTSAMGYILSQYLQD